MNLSEHSPSPKKLLVLGLYDCGRECGKDRLSNTVPKTPTYPEVFGNVWEGKGERSKEKNEYLL